MSLSLECHCEHRGKWGPHKACFVGERRSQDTGGIFCLQKMEHCILRFDEVAIRNFFKNGFPRRLRLLGMTPFSYLNDIGQLPSLY